MRASEGFGFCNCKGSSATKRAFDVPFSNNQLLVRSEVVQNACQSEQVLFTRFHGTKNMPDRL